MRGEANKDASEEMREDGGDKAGRGARSGGARAAGRKRGAARSCGDPRAGGRGAGRRAPLDLTIRLCHTRGAADNFITSAYKNDCRRMQMARGSPPPASLCRRLRAEAREPPDVRDGPAARAPSSRAPAPPDRGPPRPRSEDPVDPCSGNAIWAGVAENCGSIKICS